MRLMLSYNCCVPNILLSLHYDGALITTQPRQRSKNVKPMIDYMVLMIAIGLLKGTYYRRGYLIIPFILFNIK